MRRVGWSILGSDEHRSESQPTPSCHPLMKFLQVFHATDDSTLALALTAFQALFATLYPDFSPVAAPVELAGEDATSMSIDSPRLTGIEGIGIKVISNSLEELREPEKSNAVPAMKILAALVLCSRKTPFSPLIVFAD